MGQPTDDTVDEIKEKLAEMGSQVVKERLAENAAKEAANAPTTETEKEI
jgi:methionyl-tRNA formyltransferase